MKDLLNVLLYYFPNKKVAEFLLNDLFVELRELISLDMIYSNKNRIDSMRTQNRNKVEDIVIKYFNDNPVYITEFKKLYQKDFMEVIDVIIETFSYSILLNDKKVYKDKKSIMFSNKPSPFDIFN